MMRRTIVLLGASALLIAAVGGRALAAPQSPNVTFTLSCPNGIEASGHGAGWYGPFVVEEGTNVSVPSVVLPWAFDQETWVNSSIPPSGDPNSTGSIERPGVHPGAVLGCEAALEWDYLGDHYYAELHNMEATFRPAP